VRNPEFKAATEKLQGPPTANLCRVSGALLHYWVFEFIAVRRTQKAIKGWVFFSFFLFFSLCWNQFSTLLFYLILWDFSFFYVENKLSGGEIPSEREKKKKKLTLCETLNLKQLRKIYKVLCGKSLSSFCSALALLSSRVYCYKRNSEGNWRLGYLFIYLFILGLKSILYIAFFFDFVGFYFLLCRIQTQWWWNPFRKRKKKKKLTLCETLNSRQVRKSCRVLYNKSLLSF
jgi:hypothetical protein